MDHVSLFAIAVNEENAAGGRIVTAPTNGAAGVVPAVLRYYRDFWPGADRAGMHDILLTASAIGRLTKLNASISGVRSEQLRVGKEFVRTWRSRWRPSHSQ